MLRRRGRITEWFDRNIEAGGEWRAEIAEQLDSADLILLLISSDFLDSDFSYEEEMMRAMERSDRDEARVIAVMLRPVDGWEHTPFSKLQVVPRDALPVTRWEDQDEALVDVAAQVRRTVERLQMSEVPASTVAPRSDGRRDRETTSYSTRRREIVAALEELLARPGEHLIISVAHPPNYYVQFLAEEGALWCEAVSNQWIEPQHALGAEEMARLAELGWNAPEENLPNGGGRPRRMFPLNASLI
jgi:cell pole-organizing protein PopZ